LCSDCGGIRSGLFVKSCYPRSDFIGLTSIAGRLAEAARRIDRHSMAPFEAVENLYI